MFSSDLERYRYLYKYYQALYRELRAKTNKQRRKNKRSRKSPYEFFLLQAKKRGIAVDIHELDYLELVSKPCYYCYSSLGKKGARLDRLNNHSFYTLDNVVPCCGKCNLVRGNRLTSEEMQNIAVHLPWYNPFPGRIL